MISFGLFAWSLVMGWGGPRQVWEEESETDYTWTQERGRDEKLDSSRGQSHQPDSRDMKYLALHRLHTDSLFCMISMQCLLSTDISNLLCHL